ncbi:2Fe-2S iron-sulfur cluster-binding protein [Amycolatopsis sp. cmx-4-68]|uniref:2Fe-2S iron-sulfur cluster-binding protein n=1 Tax=Amycolatopsis sp. cmx-4-68 TaxID=2790938 RepID=UPI00397AB4B5
MPYSCTVGTCAECRVKLVRGDVDMAEPNCLTSEERAEGYVLACMSRPLSPTTVDIGVAASTGRPVTSSQRDACVNGG